MDPRQNRFFLVGSQYQYRTPNSLFSDDLIEIYPSSERAYHCASINDPNFAKLGILRCISHAKTGQEFLQHHSDQGEADIDPGHFSEALKSPRRLVNITSLNALLPPVMRRRCDDPFARFGELDDFDIYGADGHYQHAAAHDPKRGEDGGQTIATGHFFQPDLRCHHLGYIGLGEPDAGKKKSHEITVIKRATPETLRNGAAKGRKVIYAWDNACSDYRLWHRLKHNSGIYFITIEKSNSAAQVCSRNLIDPADPRGGTHYTHLTNEMTLPAHQLDIVYKCRWDIEKVLNELRGKTEERKSWAGGPEAKRAHGQFECLAHNLTLLAEPEMKGLGLGDKVEMKKGIQRGKTRRNRAALRNSEGVRAVGQRYTTLPILLAGKSLSHSDFSGFGYAVRWIRYLEIEN
jgi:hypothetical protein